MPIPLPYFIPPDEFDRLESYIAATVNSLVIPFQSDRISAVDRIMDNYITAHPGINETTELVIRDYIYERYIKTIT